MSAKRNPGRLEQIISRVGEEKAAAEAPQSFLGQIRTLIKRRIVAGVLFLIPIATTIWFVSFFLKIIYTKFAPLMTPILQSWGMKPEGHGFQVVAVLLSLFIVLVLLYLIGVFVSRAAVRRLIGLAESILVRIPFVKFFYKTTKQIVETLSLQSQGAFKKAVLIEYPRPGVRTLAFATGETPVVGHSTPWVNLFVPTTPNPTSGYLVLLPPGDVLETDLTMEEAMTFIVSGGILPPERLHLSPYRPRSAEVPSEPGGPAAGKQGTE